MKTYQLRLIDLTTTNSVVLAEVQEDEHQRFHMIAERMNYIFGGYGEWQCVLEEVPFDPR